MKKFIFNILDYLLNIVVDIQSIVATLFKMESLIIIPKLIAYVAVLFIPTARGYVFEMINSLFQYNKDLAILAALIYYVKEAQEIVEFHFILENREDYKPFKLLEELSLKILKLLNDLLIKPIKGIFKNDTKTKEEKVSLKDESEPLKIEEKTTKEIPFKDDIIQYTNELSTKCDALYPESKKEFVSELKQVVGEYTTKLKEMILKKEEGMIPLENEDTLHVKALEKLTLIDLKIQKQLIKEGKVSVISEEEKRIFQILDQKEKEYEYILRK